MWEVLEFSRWFCVWYTDKELKVLINKERGTVEDAKSCHQYCDL